jgi:hypothetical protein
LDANHATVQSPDCAVWIDAIPEQAQADIDTSRGIVAEGGLDWNGTDSGTAIQDARQEEASSRASREEEGILYQAGFRSE